MRLELTHGWNVDDINDALDDPDTFAGAESGLQNAGSGNDKIRQASSENLGFDMVDRSMVVDPQLEDMQV